MDRSHVEQKQKVGICEPEKSADSLHLVFELDWAIGRVVATLLNLCLVIILIGMALGSIWLELINIFEHQEGLSDISTAEAVFAVLALALLKRYFFYTRRISERWWNILFTPLIWYGRFVLAAWLVASIVAFSDLLEGTEYLKWALLHGENYNQIFAFACMLLSLYIAVPSKKKKVKVLDFQAYHANDGIAQENTTSQEQPKTTTSDI